jgi:hypothetical protein
MATLDKPADVFDRAYEWDDLARFATEPAPGLRIAVVRGRRRHGKSFLLERLCRGVDALTRQSPGRPPLRPRTSNGWNISAVC